MFKLFISALVKLYKDEIGAIATDVTAAQVRGANERGDHLRRVAFAQEVWSLAQSKESKLKMDGCTHKTVTDNLTWYPRVTKTSYRKKQGGVQPTPLQEGKYDRRGLITQS